VHVGARPGGARHKAEAANITDTQSAKNAGARGTHLRKAGQRGDVVVGHVEVGLVGQVLRHGLERLHHGVDLTIQPGLLVLVFVRGVGEGFGRVGGSRYRGEGEVVKARLASPQPPES